MSLISRFSVLTVLVLEASAGQCTDSDKLLWKGSAEFATTMETTGLKSTGSKRRAGVYLKKHYPTMTDACIGCHADLLVCGYLHCFSPCMKGKYSVECKSCIERKCTPDYKLCLGVDNEDELPVPPAMNAVMPTKADI